MQRKSAASGRFSVAEAEGCSANQLLGVHLNEAGRSLTILKAHSGAAQIGQVLDRDAPAVSVSFRQKHVVKAPSQIASARAYSVFAKIRRRCERSTVAVFSVINSHGNGDLGVVPNLESSLILLP
jgi:hypothetical protein